MSMKKRLLEPSKTVTKFFNEIAELEAMCGLQLDDLEEKKAQQRAEIGNKFIDTDEKNDNMKNNKINDKKF